MPESKPPRRPRRETVRVALPTLSERKLADDLHTHQIELQMQNQELVRTKNELEVSRSRYFELFDFAPVAYFTFDERGAIDALNLAAAELLQIDRQRGHGTPFSIYLDDASKVEFRSHLELVFATNGKHAAEIALTPNPHGRRRHLHLVSRVVHGEFERHPTCLSAVIDITARKIAEEEVSRLNQILEQRVVQRTFELQESNRDLEAFIYSISHDLRAPLRNMAGYAGVIAEDYGAQVPAEVGIYVQRILAGNEKMLRLVDDLLRFSRLGRAPLELTRTNLDDLVDEALVDLAPELNTRSVVWRRTPLPVAQCDRGLMRQVFVNLLSNAVKYTRPRKPAIISIGSEIRNGERVVLVQDNGVGFDMAHYDKLFGVFQRLPSASGFEGNGVGLAMSARILQRHGGSAYAEGRLDQGATFWFSFDGLRHAL